MNAVGMTQNTKTLLSCMEQVTMEWAFLSLDYLGEPGFKPAKLPLERKITLRCQGQEACLVLRASFGLGLELARSVRGISSSSLEAGEASFNELCGLIAMEWCRREYSESSMTWQAGESQASTADSWPTAAPDSAVVATVRGLAIEALLWVSAKTVLPSQV